MEMTHDRLTLAPQREASVPSRALLGAESESARITLKDLPIGAEAHVIAVAAPDSGIAGNLGRRLAELGFLPGERIRIVARGFLGREPIAVRIGTGTFALRSFEAACIQVRPELPPDS